jgi:Ca2+-binding RTX toxin-like protein
MRPAAGGAGPRAADPLVPTSGMGPSQAWRKRTVDNYYDYLETDVATIGDYKQMYGGSGNDNLGSEHVGAVYLDGGEGNDAVLAVFVEGTFGTLSGGDGTDIIIGGSSGFLDYLYGGSGNDYVRGGDTGALGPDYLDGGSGSDALYGDLGNDTLYGGTGDDPGAPFAFGPSTIIPLGLYGGVGNDRLDGQDGNDLLDGGMGGDALIGGLGNDTFVVDSAGDRVTESQGGGVDRVESSVGLTLTGYNEIEALVSTGLNVSLTGSLFANALTGDKGANKLAGRAGNDTLTGGAGKDVFVFNTAPNKSSNVDRITDFRWQDDTVHLDNAYLKKVGSNGKLKADAFHLGKKAADAEDRVIYDKGTGNVYYDADGTGKIAAIKIAILQKNATLKVSDFLVI